MGDLLKAVEFLGIPTTVAIVLVVAFLIMQVIGKLLEFKGKIVPEYLNIKKYFDRKRQEKEEREQTLRGVQALLQDVNKHYSADNITKRDTWMHWVDDKALSYDNFIKEITEKFETVTEALKENTKMTEEMFVENSRDRIIDFAEKVADPNYIASHEQFRRIFRVYECYETWLEEHDRTNGEVNANYKIIQDAYTYRVNNHCFAENLNRYDTK